MGAVVVQDIERADPKVIAGLAAAGVATTTAGPRPPRRHRGGGARRYLESMPAAGPATREGVWFSPDGKRALLVAETRAAASNLDAQARAVSEVRSAFAAALDEQFVRPPRDGVVARRQLGGPPPVRRPRWFRSDLVFLLSHSHLSNRPP